jgi:ELWxxDGT repeat protein
MKKQLSLAFLLLANIAFAQYPTLLKDINTLGNDAPYNLTDLNGIVYFIDSDELHGEELWKTDGTAAGTVMVKDINVGFESSHIQNITKSGANIFFVAYQPLVGIALWKTDGTELGTVLVKDISSNTDPYNGSPAYLTDVNGLLFFSAEENTNGRELWKSDGTLAGTVMMKDIKSGSASSEPSYLLNVNGTLFFSANDGINGRELWISSGTPSSTILHRDINPGADGSNPSNLNFTVVNTAGNLTYNLFFNAFTPANGSELYRLPLTCSSCTLFLYDINVGTGSSYPDNFKIYVNSILYFAADDGTFGKEVWRLSLPFSNAQLVRLTDINPGIEGSYPNDFNVYGDGLYFRASNPITGTELYKHNTTAVTLFDLAVGAESSYPSNFKILNNQLYFNTTNYATKSGDLLRIAASGGSPQAFQNIVPTDFFDQLAEVAFYSGFSIFSNNQLFFAKVDATNGAELWKTDGTTTALVKDISAGGSSPNSFIKTSTKIYFLANDFAHGVELWKTDGTNGNTVLVKDIRLGSSFSDIKMGVELGSNLIFAANDGLNGNELWKSDCTEAGTQMILDINTDTGFNGEVLGSLPFGFSKLGSNVLFFTSPSGFGGGSFNLWKTDGTTAGTSQISSLTGQPSNMILLNGFIYFTLATYTGMGGTLGVWKTDGITNQLITTITTSPTYPLVSTLELMGNKFFFSANSNFMGVELWISDGTAAGTTQVIDINVGTNSSNPQNLTANATTLYFTAETASNGRELWKSDGTAAGTVMVKDINVSIFGPINSNPQNLTFLGNLLFFSAITSNPSLFSPFNFGRELWRTDGTSANTFMVKDINPADGGSGIADNFEGKFATTDPAIYFPANNGIFGTELWISTGTETSMVVDLLEGNYQDGLYPNTQIFANPASGQVFYEGTNGQNGRELYSFFFCPNNLTINTTVQTPTQKQQGFTSLTSTSKIVNTNFAYGDLDVKYSSAKSILLLPGFEVKALQQQPLIAPPMYRNTVFKASIGGCN